MKEAYFKLMNSLSNDSLELFKDNLERFKSEYAEFNFNKIDFHDEQDHSVTLKILETHDYLDRIDYIQHLIDVGYSVNTPTNHGYTLFTESIRNHELDLIHFLIRHNAILDVVEPETNLTLVYFADEVGCQNIRDVLVELGAKVDPNKKFKNKIPQVILQNKCAGLQEAYISLKALLNELGYDLDIDNFDINVFSDKLQVIDFSGVSVKNCTFNDVGNVKFFVIDNDLFQNNFFDTKIMLIDDVEDISFHKRVLNHVSKDLFHEGVCHALVIEHARHYIVNKCKNKDGNFKAKILRKLNNPTSSFFSRIEAYQAL
ncbi:MAG: hypothetical protein J0G32_01305 [Alphaproteobacteria bacterium]|nr:hypothetical protein [Alphaproteobacteria bacterium]OJV13196.1 MAG: hypothetical protein BGO27_00125 [Alphaproteobacteria bacterium 33-17]